MGGFRAVASLLLHWLKARRGVLFYLAATFILFFWVYALHRYPWGVAGYAALLALALGAVLAAFNLAGFIKKHRELTRAAGLFPVEALPEPAHLIEEDFLAVIHALEAERRRLAAENERARWDAQEYYSLWAHQIKTPIAAMGLLLQSRGSGIPGEAKAGLEQELFRIGQYVDMVLQYQRLSFIGNDLALDRFAVSALLKQAAKNCAALFIYKGLSLRIAPMDRYIVTDEKWFCFVLEQLFSNAVKYTARGEVRAYAGEPDTLIIEDTGTGIPAQDLPRVFERGFTGAAGRTERSSTGIGLYLCRRVLNRLGFGISLESEVGRGTRVVLRLTQREWEPD